MAEIRVENLNYTYSKGLPYEMKALDNVSVTFESGKITGLIGHTGCGKSTLVQMLNGLMKPDSGKVYLDGKDIWEKPKEISKVRFRVGLVMQYPEYQLFDETVEKDIAFGPKNMGITGEKLNEVVLKAAKFSGVKEKYLKRSPFDLSGGQKRRVALAGVIAMEPEVLVLDEPAAGLDPGGRKEILDNIKAFGRESGTTIVIVSHSMEDMAKYCDNLIVMSQGKIIMNGTPPEVFSRSNEMCEYGLDVPEITKVANALPKFGIDIGNDVYTVNYAFEKLTEK